MYRELLDNFEEFVKYSSTEEIEEFSKEALSDLELDKEASIIGLLGAGAAAHLIPNVGMKIVKNTERGRNALAGLFGTGVEHGAQGKTMHPNVRRAFEYGVGPESLLDYHLGNKIGKKLKDIDTKEHGKLLKGFLDDLGNDVEDIKNLPILGSAARFAEGKASNRTRKVLNKLPTVPHDTKESVVSKAVGAGAGAGAVAANPHIAAQFAVNATRKAVGHSEVGKKFFKNQFEKGLEGKPMSKIKQEVSEFVVSPSVNDTYKNGLYFSKKLGKDDKQFVLEKLDEYLTKHKNK